MARIELSNIGGGGTTLSLTTTGTSGASTLAGSVLNIPVYQGQLTLTTTGTSGAATLVGNTLNIPQYSGGGTPAGSTGQIQYNNAGAFGASSNLAWDNTNVRLNIGAPSSPTGRLNIRGGGATSSTINSIWTNSSNTELMRINDVGSVGIGGLATTAALEINRIVGSNNPSMFLQNTFTTIPNYSSVGFSPNINTNTVAFWSQFGLAEGGFQLSGFASTSSTYAAANIIGYAGASNTTWGAVAINGFKHNGSTNRAALSGNEMILSVESNFVSFFGFRANGNLNIGSNFIPSARLHVRGANTTAGVGALLVENSTPTSLYRIDNDGKVTYLATNTAAGTTGAQTINRPSGTVNFAAGATALVVTNSLCTTASLVFAEVRTNDATAQIKNVVPAAGSFTINLSAAATAETSVGFFIIN